MQAPGTRRTRIGKSSEYQRRPGAPPRRRPRGGGARWSWSWSLAYHRSGRQSGRLAGTKAVRAWTGELASDDWKGILGNTEMDERENLTVPSFSLLHPTIKSGNQSTRLRTRTRTNPHKLSPKPQEEDGSKTPDRTSRLHTPCPPALAIVKNPNCSMSKLMAVSSCMHNKRRGAHSRGRC